MTDTQNRNRTPQVLPKWALEGWVAFTEIVGPKPFRLSALTKLLYPKTNPRSLERAQRLATQLIRRAHKAGEIERHGHLHWVRLAQGRVLKGGRKVPEYTDLITLAVTTHCPDKYALVDLETWNVWQGTASSWKSASARVIEEAAAALEMAKR